MQKNKLGPNNRTPTVDNFYYLDIQNIAQNLNKYKNQVKDL